MSSAGHRAPAGCPFCALEEAEIRSSNEHALAFFDRFPLVEGHTLVIPRRHIASIFDANAEELAAIWRLVGEVRSMLEDQFAPDAFTVGVNDGAEAGQTVAHGHIHVVPRRRGDVKDPRGGVRWVIPEKAAYWQVHDS